MSKCVIATSVHSAKGFCFTVMALKLWDICFCFCHFCHHQWKMQISALKWVLMLFKDIYRNTSFTVFIQRLCLIFTLLVDTNIFPGLNGKQFKPRFFFGRQKRKKWLPFFHRKKPESHVYVQHSTTSVAIIYFDVWRVD